MVDILFGCVVFEINLLVLLFMIVLIKLLLWIIDIIIMGVSGRFFCIVIKLWFVLNFGNMRLRSIRFGVLVDFNFLSVCERLDWLLILVILVFLNRLCSMIDMLLWNIGWLFISMIFILLNFFGFYSILFFLFDVGFMCGLIFKRFFFWLCVNWSGNGCFL